MSSIERTLHADLDTLPEAAQVLARMLAGRFSCRGFRPDPVPQATIEAMLALAQHSPSWCNSQPWQVHVTDGAATERLRAALYARAQGDAAAGTMASEPDLPFPGTYRGVYKERQREVGWQLYEAVGVTHGDRAGSGKQMLENFRLFGAPHALVLTTERELGVYGVLDCGIYLGSLLLAAEALGIGIVPQAAFANYAPLLRDVFDIPEERAIVCGASFGYPDAAHPANSFRSRRAPVTDAVFWHHE